MKNFFLIAAFWILAFSAFGDGFQPAPNGGGGSGSQTPLTANVNGAGYSITNASFSGNGGGLTNFPANSGSFGTLSPDSTGTNFTVNLSGPVSKAYIWATNNVDLYPTNGPGSETIYILDNGTTNHVLFLATNLNWVVPSFFSVMVGTNYTFILTNGVLAEITFETITNAANPAWTNYQASITINGYSPGGTLPPTNSLAYTIQLNALSNAIPAANLSGIVPSNNLGGLLPMLENTNGGGLTGIHLGALVTNGITSGTVGQFLMLTNTGTGFAWGTPAGGGGGSGTVTSVSGPSGFLTWANSTTAAAATLNSQPAGSIFGNGGGSSAAPAPSTNGTYTANTVNVQQLNANGASITAGLITGVLTSSGNANLNDTKIANGSITELNNNGYDLEPDGNSAFTSSVTTPWIVYTSTTTTPTGAQIGAGNAIAWVSNAVFYVSVSTDGSTVNTKLLAP